jgi:LmbE family N-acetylglucosaminyl deacetylase
MAKHHRNKPQCEAPRLWSRARSLSRAVLATAVIGFCALAVASPARADILILSPHPDDDVLTAAGVIYRAASAGVPVRIVYITNGDRSTVQQGYIRQGEAVNAVVGHLGLREDDLIFLGYPDGQLNNIFINYPNAGDQLTAPNGQSTTYGNRGLGRSDYSTYRFGAPAAYNRANMVRDLRDIIETYRPSHIFTTAEFDSHPDHYRTYELLNLALAEAFPSLPGYNPTIHRTSVWPIWHNELDPTGYLQEGPNLSGTGLLWSQRESLDVPLPMQSWALQDNPKYQAIAEHYSEGGINNFSMFVHKDEVFWVSQGRGSNRPPVVNAGFDQDVPEGSLVQLDGSASFDLNGDALTYFWRQVSGRAVQLSDSSIARPTFIAPSNLSRSETLVFELVVGDGQFWSVPDAVSVVVRSPLDPQYGSNVALAATVTASSENASAGQQAIKVIDGVADGYPGDHTREWATLGERAGAWIQLSWSQPITIGRIHLFDRPNTSDHITAATLHFSDGTTLSTGALDNYGGQSVYTFEARTVTSIRLVVNEVSANTRNVGLSEFEVYDVGGNRVPVANAGSDQTVGEGETVRLDGSASYDIDGDPLTYRWTQTAGRAVTLSDRHAVNPTFVAPTGLTADEVLAFDLVVNDGYIDSAPNTVRITVIAENPGSTPGGTNVAPLATVTASSENARTGQFAIKAVDEIVDGYPGDYTREWATTGEGAGAWIQLTWSSARNISRIVLHDRPNSNDQILSATVLFSDGSTLAIGSLPNDSTAASYSFAARSVTSLRLTVNSVSTTTRNIGLAEIFVYEDGGGAPANQAPIANAGPDQTVNQGATVQLDGRGSSDPDGDPLTYSWTQTAGPTVTLSNSQSAQPTFTAPSGSTSDQTLTFQLVVSDGQLNSSPDTVNVTVLAPTSNNQPPVADAGPDQTVSQGATVQLNGTGSFDPDGDPLTYSWTQTAGPAVTLSNPQSAQPTFTAPSGSTTNQTLTFQLVVSDGQLSSAPDTVDITVLGQVPTGSNIAPLATVTASSETVSTGQLAIKAVDGVVDGFPGDSTREWASNRERAGAWIQLTWSSPRNISRIVLHDRPNSKEQILGATVQFSDGSTLAIGALPNDGTAAAYSFAPRSVTSLRLTVTSVSTSSRSIGLAEILVFE